MRAYFLAKAITNPPAPPRRSGRSLAGPPTIKKSSRTRSRRAPRRAKLRPSAGSPRLGPARSPPRGCARAQRGNAAARLVYREVPGSNANRRLNIRASAELAADYLTGLGHRIIGHVGGPEGNLIWTEHAATFRGRAEVGGAAVELDRAAFAEVAARSCKPRERRPAVERWRLRCDPGLVAGTIGRVHDAASLDHDVDRIECSEPVQRIVGDK